MKILGTMEIDRYLVLHGRRKTNFAHASRESTCYSAKQAVILTLSDQCCRSCIFQWIFVDEQFIVTGDKTTAKY